MYRRARAFTPDRWRLLRHVYYRLVEKVDAQIGQILTALRELGQEENTLVVFTSDHGDMAGAHELNQKHSLYDESARIPLLIAGPGVAGNVVDEPVSHADVLPTLCDLAQVDPPGASPASASAPPSRGDRSSASRWSSNRRGVARSPAPSLPWRAIVTRHHKYVLHDWGANREQLFDRAPTRGSRSTWPSRRATRRWSASTGADCAPGAKPRATSALPAHPRS